MATTDNQIQYAGEYKVEKLKLHTARGSFPPSFGDGELVEEFHRGTYQLNYQFQLKDNPDAQFPIIFKPGQYELHHYSKYIIFDKFKLTFF